MIGVWGLSVSGLGFRFQGKVIRVELLTLTIVGGSWGLVSTCNCSFNPWGQPY